MRKLELNRRKEEICRTEKIQFRYDTHVSLHVCTEIAFWNENAVKYESVERLINPPA